MALEKKLRIDEKQLTEKEAKKNELLIDLRGEFFNIKLKAIEACDDLRTLQNKFDILKKEEKTMQREQRVKSNNEVLENLR